MANDKWDFEALQRETGLLNDERGINRVEKATEVPIGYRQVHMCVHRDQLYTLFHKGIGRFYQAITEGKSKGTIFVSESDLKKIIDWRLTWLRRRADQAATSKREQTPLPMEPIDPNKPMVDANGKKVPSLVNQYAVICDSFKKLEAKLDRLLNQEG